MAARYWIGGTGTWSSTNTANWSATSGGAGGASVPTSADTPTFDANSGSGVVTFTNGGVTVGATTINNANITLSLGAAFTSSGAIGLTAGAFTTNNYNVTATSLSSSNSNVRSVTLGSSTVTLTTGSVVFTTSTNLTFSAGTSTIVCQSANFNFLGGGQTFYNVSFTSPDMSQSSMTGANTFNNLTFAGRGPLTAGRRHGTFSFGADITVNGTLTFGIPDSPLSRTRFGSVGAIRVLTCNAVSALQDLDFVGITFAGAAVAGGPLSGVRLGDAGNNSGIVFDAPKTVYWAASSAAEWYSNSWALAVNDPPSTNYFPLLQDTAVITNAKPTSGTINTAAQAVFGSVDLSGRTSALSISLDNFAYLHGNWKTGTGITYVGSGLFYYQPQRNVSLQMAGKVLPYTFQLSGYPTAQLSLLDAFSNSSASSNAIDILSGVLNTGGYTVSQTATSGGVSLRGSGQKALNLAGSTISIAGTSGFDASTATAATTTFSGGGTITLTSASAKTFAGGGIQTYPTINQGGTGTLTITGSNKFANITNTAIGRVQFTGGTTNEFTAFNLNGVPGNLLQVGSTNTTQVTLKAPSWNVGANSTDAGNNTGLTFSAGSVNYLSISYVNGNIVAGPASSIYYGAANITAIYYGSTPVSAVYYGSTKVF